MSRIVAVEPDPRRPGAVRIQGDGGTRRTIALEDAAALGVIRGAEVAPALDDALERAADAEAAFRTALRALERRPFARADLGRKLVKKGHPRPAVDSALERLTERGLLDDAAFVRNYVETRTARGRGPARLKRDLLAMGLADHHIKAGLAAAPSTDEALVDQAVAVARRKAGLLADLPRPVRRRRLLAFLARRGFGGQCAGAAVKRIEQER